MKVDRQKLAAALTAIQRNVQQADNAAALDNDKELLRCIADIGAWRRIALEAIQVDK